VPEKTKTSRRKGQSDSATLVEWDTLRDGIEANYDGGQKLTRAIVIAESEASDGVELTVWAFQGDNALPQWAVEGMLAEALRLLLLDD